MKINLSIYTYQALLLLKRLLLALIFLFFSRLIFWLYNLSFFKFGGVLEFIRVFFYGSYFDLISLFYFMLPFVLLSILPFSFFYKRNYQLVLKVLFTLIITLLFVLTVVDTVYFPFSKSRLGIEAFKMAASEEISTINYIISYWYFLPLIILFSITIFKLYPQSFMQSKAKWYWVMPINLFFLILLIITIRGGFRLKPLRSIDTSLFVAPQYVQLAISTGFNFIESIQSESIENTQYLSKEEINAIMKNDYLLIKSNGIKAKNIFIIILESFGKEYCFPANDKTASYTPFLKQLALNSEFYSKAYSNGTRSVDAIPAILEGIPKLTKSDFMYSNYIKNITPGFAYYLSKMGYSCNFYHGGINGTLGFEAFLKSRGWNYFGKNQYSGSKSDYDGNWGIYDGPYLKYIKNEVGKLSKPFVNVVFTLSSHHPYTLPNDYKDSFKSIKKPIHKTIKYVDNCLKAFFESIKNEKWYNETVFIITADHSAENFTKQYSSMNGKYEVPLLVFEPSKPKADTINTIIQHIDILPLALYKTGFAGKIFTLGAFFKNDISKMSYHNEDGIYKAFTDSVFMTFDGKKSKFLNIYNKNIPEENKCKKLEYDFKGIIQDFNFRITNNKYF